MRPEALRKRTYSFLQESILKIVQYEGWYLQFAPVVFSFLWYVKNILLSTNVAVTSDKSVLVDWVPVDEQVLNRAVIMAQNCRQCLYLAISQSIIGKPK